MADEIAPVPIRAWKRERPTTPSGGSRPMMCGGPEYTSAERLELMRERQRAMDEAARRAREETDTREAGRRRPPTPTGEEDDHLAAGRRRTDRYAVTLLRQDDSAWGGGVDSGPSVRVDGAPA
ncbi:hypothetical protein [Micromonospora sp. NPDC048898]|uniref:hypothetical protein n=1 Tax=Micromonospora sp. NPDC048898 TaxID=3364260 RepID=UPI00371DB596